MHTKQQKVHHHQEMAAVEARVGAEAVDLEYSLLVMNRRVKRYSLCVCYYTLLYITSRYVTSLYTTLFYVMLR